MTFRRLTIAGRSSFGIVVDLGQHAVEAVPDPDDLLFGLDVEVAGARAHGVLDEHLDESHDGRVLRRHFDVRLVERRHPLVDERLQPVQRARPVRLVDQLRDGALGRADDFDPHVDLALELVDQHHVEGVRLRHLEVRAVREMGTNMPRRASDSGTMLAGAGVGRDAVERRERHPGLLGQRYSRGFSYGQVLHRHEDVSRRAFGLCAVAGAPGSSWSWLMARVATMKLTDHDDVLAPLTLGAFCLFDLNPVFLTRCHMLRSVIPASGPPGPGRPRSGEGLDDESARFGG